MTKKKRKIPRNDYAPNGKPTCTYIPKMFVKTATIIEVILWNPFQSKSFFRFSVTGFVTRIFFVWFKNIIMDRRMVSDCSQSLLNGINKLTRV